METIFSLGGLVVAPSWLLMILAPSWSWTTRIVRSPLIVVLPALAYAAIALPDIATLLPTVARPELPAIATLLGSERGTTLAWMHFLAFDLFVGRWVYLDARERRIPALVSSPILVFVLLLGPVGYLAYLVARAIVGVRPESAVRAEF